MITDTPATPLESSSRASSVLFKVLRGLGLIALVLMLASIIYSGWIALENWGTIQV